MALGLFAPAPWEDSLAALGWFVVACIASYVIWVVWEVAIAPHSDPTEEGT